MGARLCARALQLSRTLSGAGERSKRDIETQVEIAWTGWVSGDQKLAGFVSALVATLNNAGASKDQIEAWLGSGLHTNSDDRCQ